MDARLAELIEKARTAEALLEHCAIHEIFADDESQIRPGAVRSYLCVNCGSRFSPKEAEANWHKFAVVPSPVGES